MKHIKILGILFAVIILLAGCREDDNFYLTINVKPTYDGAPLVMFEDYEYPTGEALFFSRYSLFMTNIALNHTEGQDQLLDATYLNFTNQNVTVEGAKEGLNIVIKDIPKKDYDQLFFMIGVDQTNNAKEPKDFDSSSVLSSTAEYWPGWQSYIFTRTEGQIDLGDAERTLFSLHTGADEALVNLLAEVPNLGKNGDQTITIEIDVRKTFGTDKIYDIAQYPSIHTLALKPQVLELAENLKDAVSVNLR